MRKEKREKRKEKKERTEDANQAIVFEGYLDIPDEVRMDGDGSYAFAHSNVPFFNRVFVSCPISPMHQRVFFHLIET